MKIVFACTIFLVLSVIISSVECKAKRRSTGLELENVDDKTIEIISKSLKEALEIDTKYPNRGRCKHGKRWSPYFQKCVVPFGTSNAFGNPGFGGKK